MTSLGRPSLLTPKTKQKLIEAIKAGSHYETACAYAGISYSTFREWMQRGQGTHKRRKTDQDYVDFADAILEAESQGEISAIAAIKAASKNDWKAAAWMLERRHSARWASTQKVQLQVEQQLAENLDLLFGAIASDPDIPAETKQLIFEKAASIQTASSVADRN